MSGYTLNASKGILKISVSRAVFLYQISDINRLEWKVVLTISTNPVLSVVIVTN